MSTRWGIPKSLVKTAFSECRERTSNLVSGRLLASWLWILSWQARANYRRHWKLSAANSVWTSKDLNLGSQLASDDNRCSDTRKRFPWEWLIRRLLKSLNVRPQRIYYSTQRWNFLMRIATVTIQRCHTNSLEDVYISGARKDSNFVVFFLKLHAAATVWLRPNDAARQNPRIHPIQYDGLKQATNWMHTRYVEKMGRM